MKISFYFLIKTMTDNLEGDKYITLHLVWTSFLDISDILKESEVDIEHGLDGQSSITIEMKKIGREYCVANERDMEPSFHHKAMTFLTPHYKRLDFIATRDKFKLQAEIETYLDDNFVENDINQNVLTNDQNIQSGNIENTNCSSNLTLKIQNFYTMDFKF